jgi:tetratricopeptide (TPR) repeat protein
MERRFFDFWIFSLKGYRSAAAEWNRKGARLFEAGELNEALECFNMAIAIEPCHGESYFNRGKVHFAFAMYDEALEDYREAIKNGCDKARKTYSELLILHRGDVIQK